MASTTPGGGPSSDVATQIRALQAKLDEAKGEVEDAKAEMNKYKDDPDRSKFNIALEVRKLAESAATRLTSELNALRGGTFSAIANRARSGFDELITN